MGLRKAKEKKKKDCTIEQNYYKRTRITVLKKVYNKNRGPDNEIKKLS